MSHETSTKTFTIEQVLQARDAKRSLTNLKFMVSSQGDSVSPAGLRRVAAKLMNARDTGALVFSREMRKTKSENYLISDFVA